MLELISVIRMTGVFDLAKAHSYGELTSHNGPGCYISMLTLIQLGTLRSINSSNLRATPGPISYCTLLFLPLDILVDCFDYYHGRLPNLTSQTQLRN